jgi:hypothetical protein
MDRNGKQSNRRVAGWARAPIFFVIGLLLLPLAREGRHRLAPE